MINANNVIDVKDLVFYFNILIGVLIVLAVLLLAVVIALIANVKANKNKTMHQGNSIDNAIAQIVSNEHVAMSSNNELVAAITAAVYAYMGDDVPANGFVVRSIRKVR